MAEEKKLTVAEILAAARKMDGGGDAGSDASEASDSASTPADSQSVPEADSSEKPVTKAKPGSIAEKLAMARGGVGSSSAGEAKSSSAPADAAAQTDAATTKAKPGSIAEKLAMARGGVGPSSAGEAKSSSAPVDAAAQTDVADTKAKPGSIAEKLAMARGAAKQASVQGAAKTEAKPAASKKSSAKKKATGKSPPAERMDTASVLAAARGDGKRGPVSKSEAPELLQRKRPAPAASAKPDLPAMPERPAYAVPPSKGKVEERRKFLFLSALFGSSFATGMTLLGTTAVVWTLALARYLFPNVLTEPPSQFKVGSPDDFAPGQVETKFKAQFGIWLVSADYQGEPCIFALSTVCTHLGCTPNWLDSEQKFKCPCHGSGFYKDGINFEGPAPRPLERYAIRVASDGQLEVDKSRKYQEEMGQWQDPASFVPV